MPHLKALMAARASPRCPTRPTGTRTWLFTPKRRGIAFRVGPLCLCGQNAGIVVSVHPTPAAPVSNAGGNRKFAHKLLASHRFLL